MVIERMIEAGMNEFKENLMPFCEQDVEDGLTRASAQAVTQGIQRAVAAAELTVASDRMLVVDGRRTFVIGSHGNPAEDAVLDEVARAGFNLVRVSEDLSAIDRLHSRGLSAWINTGGRIKLNDNLEERKGELEDLVTRWGPHPGLPVWEVDRGQRISRIRLLGLKLAGGTGGSGLYGDGHWSIGGRKGWRAGRRHFPLRRAHSAAGPTTPGLMRQARTTKPKRTT